MSKTAYIGWRRDIRIAVVPLGAVIAASVLGQLATFPNLAPWYAGLIKPSFNPPSWVFGPVWTTLYLLMAFAAWRIMRAPSTPAHRNAIILFWAQLVLNVAWSWMFFAAHSPLLGLVNIVLQLALVIATCVAFTRIDRLAGLALVPLVFWVGYATAINAAVWWLNA